MVYRIFVEKKNELAHEAAGLYSELKNLLGIKNLESVRVLNRYDADDIDAEIFCERDTHKGMVIGKKGAMLKRISTAARAEMEQALGAHVNLQCWVKVKEDWRNRQGLLNGFGYRL